MDRNRWAVIIEVSSPTSVLLFFDSFTLPSLQRVFEIAMSTLPLDIRSGVAASPLSGFSEAAPFSPSSPSWHFPSQQSADVPCHEAVDQEAYPLVPMNAIAVKTPHPRSNFRTTPFSSGSPSPWYSPPPGPAVIPHFEVADQEAYSLGPTNPINSYPMSYPETESFSLGSPSSWYLPPLSPAVTSHHEAADQAIYPLVPANAIAVNDPSQVSSTETASFPPGSHSWHFSPLSPAMPIHHEAADQEAYSLGPTNPINPYPMSYPETESFSLGSASSWYFPPPSPVMPFQHEAADQALYSVVPTNAIAVNVPSPISSAEAAPFSPGSSSSWYLPSSSPAMPIYHDATDQALYPLLPTNAIAVNVPTPISSPEAAPFPPGWPDPSYPPQPRTAAQSHHGACHGISPLNTSRIRDSHSLPLGANSAVGFNKAPVIGPRHGDFTSRAPSHDHFISETAMPWSSGTSNLTRQLASISGGHTLDNLSLGASSTAGIEDASFDPRHNHLLPSARLQPGAVTPWYSGTSGPPSNVLTGHIPRGLSRGTDQAFKAVNNPHPKSASGPGWSHLNALGIHEVGILPGESHPFDHDDILPCRNPDSCHQGSHPSAACNSCLLQGIMAPDRPLISRERLSSRRDEDRNIRSQLTTAETLGILYLHTRHGASFGKIRDATKFSKSTIWRHVNAPRIKKWLKRVTRWNPKNSR